MPIATVVIKVSEMVDSLGGREFEGTIFAGSLNFAALHNFSSSQRSPFLQYLLLECNGKICVTIMNV
jgi:hypothetical protein